MSLDGRKIQTLVQACFSDAFVKERLRENANGPAPEFSRERFWRVLVGCLLTTQQRSTDGSPVSRFLSSNPFLLSFSRCCANPSEEFVVSTLTEFRGIRRTLTIGKQAKKNLDWLQKGGWAKIESLFNQLLDQRKRPPVHTDKNLERRMARAVDEYFAGIGPKQSRNMLQWLGLTRFEIPLDSRVAKWVNDNLSFKVEVGKLANLGYYEECLDRLQAACAEAGVLPCVFDAAAFDDENQRPDNFRRLPKEATATSYVNKNGQITVRDTGLPGTDHLQRIYQLACSHCGHSYRANGSDIHERKCPKCQGGKPGLPITTELI